jgi:ornithine--oxo-acid transaminase
MDDRVFVIGAACGLGGPDPRCAEGPAAMRKRLASRHRLAGAVCWQTTVRAAARRGNGFPRRELVAFSTRLAAAVRERVAHRERFAVIGGDHSCAIGTWNGVSAAFHRRGPFGLIWIDAHLDAHTPQTTPSGCAHGMPLAFLLGHGDAALARLNGRASPCLAPQHLCLIGTRSHEAGEEALLARLGVRVYPMEEVRRRGLAEIMDEALERVRNGTMGFGVSVDLDAVDPAEAPGVTTPEPRGLAAADVAAALRRAARLEDFAGLEIAELNPALDADGRTAALVEDWLGAVAGAAPGAHSAVELERDYCARNYEPLPVVLVRGKGAHVWDNAGKRYLDMMAAYSAVSFGHANARLLRALDSQARRLAVVSRAFHTDRLGPFARRLCELTGMDRVLPMNTGAEAVETALKAARKWAYKVKGVPEGRAQIVVCEGNFHGRTIAAIAMSAEPQYRDGFGPFPPGFVRIPYGDARALEAAITPDTAAFLVEPIQGEAGIVVPPVGYLAACARICRQRGALLLCDEIQTGLGRTGRLLACEHDGVKPDGIMLGKALGGGLLPVSAFLASAKVMDVFKPGDHGSTFGGNPLACAVALEALELLVEKRLVERSAELGDYLLGRLRALDSPLVREARGRGLFIGLELDTTRTSARRVAEILLRHGVLTKDTHGTVLRFAPPLTITRAQLDGAVTRIRRALDEAVRRRAS